MFSSKFNIVIGVNFLTPDPTVLEILLKKILQRTSQWHCHMFLFEYNHIWSLHRMFFYEFIFHSIQVLAYFKNCFKLIYEYYLFILASFKIREWIIIITLVWHWLEDYAKKRLFPSAGKWHINTITHWRYLHRVNLILVGLKSLRQKPREVFYYIWWLIVMAQTIHLDTQ